MRGREKVGSMGNSGTEGKTVREDTTKRWMVQRNGRKGPCNKGKRGEKRGKRGENEGMTKRKIRMVLGVITKAGVVRGNEGKRGGKTIG